MTEPTRAVARPPIGSENHLPTWTRESLSREVFRALEETRRARDASWDRWAVGFAALLLSTSLVGVIVAHTPADPLTLAGNQDD